MSPGRVSAAGRERLAFNYGAGTVPSRRLAETLIASERETTFATALKAEPRDWGYFGLLAFTAVLLLRPQDTIPPLNPLHLAELCAIVGIGPMLLHRLARRQPVFRVTPETVGLLVFGFAILGTAPFSIWPGGAVGVFTDAYMKVLVVFVLMMNTLTSAKRLDRIIWLMLVCSGIVAAQSLANYFRGIHLVEGDRLGGPGSGIFGNPNDLAMNMVTFLPLALVVALSHRYSPVRRLTAVGIAGALLATVVFTKSRGGMLGLAAMLIALVILGRRVRKGFGATVVVAVMVGSPFMPSSFWDRMASILDEKKDAQEYTGSREARRELLEEGIRTFLAHPLTGVGAGQFKNYKPETGPQQWRETHNALVQVAAETGVVGLVAFCFLIGSGAVAAASVRRMLKPPSKRGATDRLRAVLHDDDRQLLVSHTAGLTAGLVGWFVCSFFASVAYNWTFYYVLALIVAARELTLDRVIAARALERSSTKTLSVPSRRFSPQRRGARRSGGARQEFGP